MGFDALDDSLVTALRLLIATYVNDELRTSYEDDPIYTTYGYPIPLDQLPSTQLPAFSIYRVSDGLIARGTRFDDSTEIALDYFGPPFRYNDIGDCWPLLRNVWKNTVAAICADTVTIGSETLTPLETAGVVDLNERSVTARYSFATDGSNSFPFFAGRATFQTREVAASTAKPFRELLIQQRLYDDNGLIDTEQDPIVEQKLVSSAFDPLAFSSGFWGVTRDG